MMAAYTVGVHHTGLTVSRLERSVEFYKRLGFHEEARLEVAGPDVGQGTGVPGARLREAMLVRDGVRLELIEYASPAGGPPAHPNNGIGAAHIAMQVADMDAAVADLRADGVEFVSEPMTHEASGIRWVYLKDPDGITSELIQALPS